MAPQVEIPVVSGYCSRDAWHKFWCIQLLPQIWMNWRTKRTEGLPGVMMYLWALCGVPFGVYAVVQNFNIPLQIQPQCLMALCLVSWVQILIYHNKWPVWKACLMGSANGAVFAGIEAALILTLKPIYERGNDVPVLVVGIIAAILLAAGLLPPYWEIWKRRGRVIGINWVFLSIDWFGAFFSLMALAQHTFDVLGGVLYIICCLLEIGIFLSHLIFLSRSRDTRREAAARGKTFDEVREEHSSRGVPFKFAERNPRRSSECEVGKPRAGGTNDVGITANA